MASNEGGWGKHIPVPHVICIYNLKKSTFGKQDTFPEGEHPTSHQFGAHL